MPAIITFFKRLKNITTYSIKYFGRKLAKLLFRLIGALSPKKGKMIVFDSMNGKQYSCNPRAIYEYMAGNYPSSDLRFVWAFAEPEKFAPLIDDPRTTCCRYNSLKHLYYCCISDAVIFNFGWTFAERRDQIRLQTWHGGGCYKKIGLAMKYNSRSRNWFARSKMKDITHFISSSEFFTDEVIRKQYDFKGDVLSIGMPRNDVLVNEPEDKEKLSAIRRSLGLPEDAFVILYAPTYNQLNLENVEILDCGRIKAAAKKRFGKETVFLYRGHHYAESAEGVSFDKDVSSYPDMKDLLQITDLLLTNYSSSIWDFSFTGRPCLLFTPDLKEYEEFRGFDKDIREWGFPISETNDQLEDAILNFDPVAFRKAMAKHHDDLGSYETGEATEKCCAFLAEKLGLQKVSE